MDETTPRPTFSIKTQVFEGPLELLIDLIEKRKFLVNDISLASVTDEYLQYVAEMERQSLDEASQFVVLASTLLLIKSRSLLPVLELTEEEEHSIDDLQERLRLYQAYRTAGKMLADVFGVRTMYGRTYKLQTTPLFMPDQFTTPDGLLGAIQNVIAELPKKTVRPKVHVRKTVSLELMMEQLKERIERQMKFGFREFTGNSSERSTIIVGFLAILEMVKQGKVIVEQAQRFDDIAIEREGGDVPRYH